jgi:hypothetical protein
VCSLFLFVWGGEEGGDLIEGEGPRDKRGGGYQRTVGSTTARTRMLSTRMLSQKIILERIGGHGGMSCLSSIGKGQSEG